jgi:hypothetical protein
MTREGLCVKNSSLVESMMATLSRISGKVLE